MIKKFFTRGWVFLVLAFIYIPIFILIIYSFNSGKTIGVWESDTTVVGMDTLNLKGGL